MTALKLDLRNLTQAHIDEAMPHLGTCKYAAPCIIGTLIPSDLRASFDSEVLDTGIADYARDGSIEFPSAQQLRDASDMQNAFDEGRADDLADVLRKYVA